MKWFLGAATALLVCLSICAVPQAEELVGTATELSDRGHQYTFYINSFGGWNLEGSWEVESTVTGAERYWPRGEGEHAVVLYQRDSKDSLRVKISRGGEVCSTPFALIADPENKGGVIFGDVASGSVNLVPGVWSNVNYVDTFVNCWAKQTSDPSTGIWTKKCKGGTGDCSATIHFKDGTTTTYSAGCGTHHGLTGNANDCTAFCRE
jgi:hypothetical protein